VEDGDDNEVMPNVAGGEATIIQGNFQELIRNNKEASINLQEDEDEDEDEDEEEDEDEDDTLLQYCSDGGDDNNDVMSTDDEDDDS
jgi:hypothetical protein